MVPLPGDHPGYHFEISKADELLVEVNPLKGYSLTANNDTMGQVGQYPIHNFPTFDARAKRIETLLKEQLGSELTGKFTVADFTKMQLDLIDFRASELIPDILQTLDNQQNILLKSYQPANERLVLAQSLLSDWDYKASLDSKAACIFYPLLEKRSHIRFMKTILGNSALLSTLSSVAPSLNRFSIQNFMAEGSPWLQHRATLDEIICEDIGAIVDQLQSNYGDDWSWGKIHQIRFGHTLRKHDPWQHMEVGLDPIGGSPTTLAMANHNPPKAGSIEQEVYHGPAFRWVVDMADPLRFKFIIAGGNGGRPDSNYISDHYKSWLHGDYFDMSLVKDEINMIKRDQFDN